MWHVYKKFCRIKIYKMHTFITEDNHEYKNANGINKNVVDDALKCEDYKNVLFNKSYMRHEMNRI